MQDLGINVLFQGRNLERLMEGLFISFRIAILAIIISTILGIILGIIMTSKSKTVLLITRLYLEAIRIIPILVWLFLFYFTFTKIFYIHLENTFVCIFVFSLWGTAEIGDLVRSSIVSLPNHQRESGYALGLTPFHIYIHIIIPQIMKRTLPGIINLSTRMIKTTSLAVLIGVVEVLKVGQQIIEVSLFKSPSASFYVYGFLLILYFIICYPISLFSKYLEKKWEV